MDDSADRRVALRRFTAVLTRGKDLSTAEDVIRASGRLFKGKGRVLRQAGLKDWELRLAELYHPRSLYPKSLDVGVDGGDDRFPHSVYVGSARLRAGEAKKSPWVLVASPYVRLFNHLKHLSAEGAKLEFLAPNMDTVFSYFEEHRPGFRVPRIVVQMFGDVGVETVALTGRSPLRSDLRDALLRVSRPYAIRISDAKQSDSTSVSLDKRGLLWWYLRSPNQLTRILETIQLLDEIGALARSSRWPTIPNEQLSVAEVQKTRA